jgi:hypothetical protein
LSLKSRIELFDDIVQHCWQTNWRGCFRIRFSKESRDTHFRPNSKSSGLCHSPLRKTKKRRNIHTTSRHK